MANQLAAAARPVLGSRAMRFMPANSFFEHLGLVGGFPFVMWRDLREQQT